MSGLGLSIERTDELLLMIQSRIRIPDHFSAPLTTAE